MAIWFLLPLVLQTVLMAFLCTLPLFNILGYEFCFCVNIVAAITAPCMGLIIGKSDTSPWLLLKKTWTLVIVYLLPGLICISCNSLRVRNCNYWQGLCFFVLLPVLSALYGATLGLLVSRLLIWSKTYIRTFAIAGFIACPLIISLWVLYYEPPIFAFDHLWGYFAGSFYDESIAPDSRLLWFRLGTLLRIIVLSAIILSWEYWARLGTGLVFSVVLCGAVTIIGYDYKIGPQHGFRMTRQDILQQLPITKTIKNIVIHLPHGVPEDVQQAILDDHLFRLHQLSKKLNISHQATIHSYIYKNAAHKAQWMGGFHTMIAKPWLGEIHLHGFETPHPLLAHEMAHVVLAPYANNMLHIATYHDVFINMGLTEGAAQALTPDYDDMDLHHWARALYDLHILPDIRSIFDTRRFWSQSPQRAYTIAGSFMRFLLETEGDVAFKSVYNDSDFMRAYGHSLDRLISRYEKFIGSIELTEREQHIATEHFRTPSIFEKPCAHEIANLMQQAAQSEPQAAVILRKKICEHLGNTQEAQLNLAEALKNAGDSDGFLKLAQHILQQQNINTVQEAALQQSLSDTLWQKGHPEQAKKALQRILELKTYPANERLAWAHLWAMRLSQNTAELMSQFLLKKLPPVTAAIVLQKEHEYTPSDATFAYLLGRLLYQDKSWALAKAAFIAAKNHPFPLIEAERLRLLAECLWHTGNQKEALQTMQAYQKQAPTSGEVAKSIDWQERVAWQSNQN